MICKNYSICLEMNHFLVEAIKNKSRGDYRTCLVFKDMHFQCIYLSTCSQKIESVASFDNSKSNETTQIRNNGTRETIKLQAQLIRILLTLVGTKWFSI